MDDRIEHSGDSAATTRSAFGRREMLQRTGFVVGAAALWTTPLVKSISASAATGTQFVNEACVDANGKIQGAPTSLTFRLDPSPSDSDLQPAVAPWKPTQENTTQFYDDPLCDLTDEGVLAKLFIEVWFGGNLGSFPTDAAFVTFNHFAGGTFTVSRPQGGGGVANIFFRISGSGTCVQRFGFHYSCSEPLIIGDRHASVVITNYEA